MAASVSGTTYRHEPATTPLHRGIAYHARQVQRCIHCRCMPTDTLVSTCIRACARLAYTGCPRHYEHVRDNKNLFNERYKRTNYPTDATSLDLVEVCRVLRVSVCNCQDAYAGCTATRILSEILLENC